MQDMHAKDTLMLQAILINLLKGVVYQEQNPQLWHNLIQQQIAVIDYFKMIGLELFLDEAEGYAFLRQRDSGILNENGAEAGEIPQLIIRRQLNYNTSLLCVLLRKKMLEQDASGGDLRVILTKEQIVNMMLLYLPDKAHQVKTVEQIESCMGKLLELGFLRRLKNDENSYEVRRIIKAFIDATWLGSLEEKLEQYRSYANNAE